LIDQFLKLFAGFEIRNSLGGNVNGLAGFRIATTARTAPANAKASESAQLDLFTFVQALDDAFEDNLNQSLGIFFCKFRSVCYIINEIGLSHASTPFEKDCKRKSSWRMSIPFRFFVELGYQTAGIPARVKRLHRKSLRPSWWNPTDYDSFDSFVLLLPVPKSANSASEAMPPLASEV